MVFLLLPTNLHSFDHPIRPCQHVRRNRQGDLAYRLLSHSAASSHANSQIHLYFCSVINPAKQSMKNEPGWSVINLGSDGTACYGSDSRAAAAVQDHPIRT